MLSKKGMLSLSIILAPALFSLDAKKVRIKEMKDTIPSTTATIIHAFDLHQAYWLLELMR